MPIRPENRTRYPDNWKQIRHRILERAGYTCEHPGCIARHRDLGYWREGKWFLMSQAMKNAGCKMGSVTRCSDGTLVKIIMIVLTIAHLDHTPENCDESNLRAWCQRHHLAYDAAHHKATAYRTRKTAAMTRDMFEGSDGVRKA